MFILYLSGFLFRRTWRQQCRWPKVHRIVDGSPQYLSEPVYVPINNDDGYSSIDSSDNEQTTSRSIAGASHVGMPRKAVRFRDHTEVRVMTADDADEANLARLSYNEYMRKLEERARLKKKFPVPTVCKLALIFCVLWFVANLCYQEALLATEPGIVNVLSSTSGLFTLILAAIWSSGPMDKFTLSKFLAVLISLGGTAMICLSDAKLEKFPTGTIWALIGSAAYALYLVTLKRKVKDDQQLDIPMFFGFVGLFNTLILWPGLFLFHYTHWETFRLPNQTELLLMLVNGLIGTVLSELLWLWGCFLTSSLIGTLALSLTTPLTMIFDIFVKKVSYNWMFYAGVGPVFISFLAVTALSHYDNWDPALIGIKKLTKFITRSCQSARMREMNTDQRQSLIPKSAA